MLLFATVGLPDHFAADLLSVLCFGVVAVLVMSVGVVAFDFILRKVNLQKGVEDNKMSSAVVLAALILGLAWIMVTVVKSITTGG